MDRQEFIDRYPRLYHMAAGGSWPSVRDRGLMSTQSLVDLYDPPSPVREEILGRVRRRMHLLRAPGLPDVTVRDQLPLKFLHVCLLPGVTLEDYLHELNTRVFFHVTEERLRRLLGARAYRKHSHDVITIDTRDFLEGHPEVELAPYNTGDTHVPNMPLRGPSTFVPLEEYPWAEWRRRRGEANAVVELTVRHSADINPAVRRVERWQDGALVDRLV